MLYPYLRVLLLLAPAALLAPTATAQESGVEPASVAPAEDLGQEAERILTLTSGSHLRGRTKQVEGLWQFERGGGWMALPRGFVLEAHSVKDLLKEAKRRERGVQLDTADGRAELGFWMAEAGLYGEALEQLDIALRKDPDHAGTLAILARGTIPMRLDAYLPGDAPAADAPKELWLTELRKLLDGFARLSPATREVAWREVATTFGSADRALPLLEAATEILKDHSSARRALAASALRHLSLGALQVDSEAGRAGVKSLVNRAVLDGTESVRADAARTLRNLDQPALAAPFVRALSSSSSAVRANSADALGILAVPAAAPALTAALAATNAAGSVQRAPASHVFFGRQIAYIQDYDVEAFAGAVAADPQVNVLTEGAVLDVRVVAVQSQFARIHERASLRGALQHLTGQDFRNDDKKWAEWIAGHPAPE